MRRQNWIANDNNFEQKSSIPSLIDHLSLNYQTLPQNYQSYHSFMEKAKEVTIIYNKFCPFAQRALITAIQKQLPATFRKVSLGEKGDYFQSSYRKALGNDPKSDGKVPILIHGDHYLTESEPVCWYLAQAFPSGSNLIPSDTFQRARMRLLISKECNAIIELFNKAKYKQITSIEDYQQEIRNTLSQFDSAIAGDFFLGKAISLADILIYPWFERWVILQRNFQVGLGEYKRIGHWLSCMGRRRSVAETKKLTNEEYYISRSQKMFAPSAKL